MPSDHERHEFRSRDDAPPEVDGAPAGRAHDGEAIVTNGATDGAHGLPRIEELPRVPAWGVALAVVVLLGAFGGLFALGWLPRARRLAELDQRVAAYDPRPIVDLATPRQGARSIDLRLPADVRPLQETALLARANGYLKRLLVDLGDHVTEGQLLAEVDSPELDASLLQAQAAEQQAEANVVKARNDAELADATLQRYTGFAAAGGVTQQQLDERKSAAEQARSAKAAADATLAAAKADAQRLTALQGYERVTAPFAGTITARGRDVGALVSTSDAAPGGELFHLERTDVLRAFVDVPQGWSAAVPTGQEAFLTVPTAPGREFTGKVTRTAGAIDAASRTLRVQVEIENRDGQLLAGSFGTIRLHLELPRVPRIVAASAVVADATGTRVWVVDGDKVRSKPVKLGIDFGAEIEIESGLDGDERVVVNPGQRLGEGIEVRIAPPKEASR